MMRCAKFAAKLVRATHVFDQLLTDGWIVGTNEVNETALQYWILPTVGLQILCNLVVRSLARISFSFVMTTEVNHIDQRLHTLQWSIR
jgi:hypothetical protein